MMISTIRIILVLLCSSLIVFGQNQPKTFVYPSKSELPPGNIQLVEGYTHEKRRGIDSAEGTLRRTDGFSIDYSIGSLMSNFAFARAEKEKKSVVWVKRQWLPYDSLYVAYFDDGEIKAFFNSAKANFKAKTTSSHDIADFLLILMTYSPDHLKKTDNANKK